MHALPAGRYPAVCIYALELGTQPVRGGYARIRQVSWEIEDERVTTLGGVERARLVYREYRDDSGYTLEHHLRAWLGTGPIRMHDLLGRGAVLDIEPRPDARGRKVFPSVRHVSPLPAGHPVCTPEREPCAHVMGEPFAAALPDYLRRKIEACQELRGTTDEGRSW